MSLQISISNSIRGYRSVPGGIPVDPDAQAFITAAAITDPTQQAAINTLVVDLKGYSIWTKMKALYPFVGGSASTHKFNLKDPRDLDAAFRLVFFGGGTHSVNGYLPNGTNAYADTFLNDNTVMTLNNAHVSYYSRTQSNGAEIEIGVGLTANILEIRTAGITYSRVHGSLLSQFTDSDSRAFYIGNRTASNLHNTWRNGIKQNTNAGTQTSSKVNANYYICALNEPNVPGWSTKQCAFASIGDGLTDTEAANLNTRVTTFQTALNRNI